ncbi:hypothetical protein [Devosia sp. Root685]|uniref:hypothetical protein n=1 Tax=Devosia sp. Root685 TaxID=1736587 RepID=UPI000A4C75B1|nr:hypothetical protein [Devosia sp. Root685]
MTRITYIFTSHMVDGDFDVANDCFRGAAFARGGRRAARPSLDHYDFGDRQTYKGDWLSFDPDDRFADFDAHNDN